MNTQPDIKLQQGILKNLKPYLKSWFTNDERLAVICDETVARLYGEALAKSLNLDLITFASGEEHKNRTTVQLIEEALFSKGFNRHSGLIVVGGGVTLDMAGFVAATFCRGIPHIFIPTTLLAMVDAAHGGKTGINSNWGKNLIGAFYPPKAVVIDIDTLSTLSESVVKEGLVEMIKHGAITDLEYFHFLNRHFDSILCRDAKLLTESISKSIHIKMAVIAQDPMELGLRKTLNFGHTIGHALEAIMDYQISHGHAVALGMMLEGLISKNRGLLAVADAEELLTTLKKLNFSLDPIKKLQVQGLRAPLAFDKKREKGQCQMVLLEAIGKTAKNNTLFCQPVEEPLIKESLEELLLQL